MKRDLVIYGAWYFGDVAAELAAELGWNVLGRIDPEPPAHLQPLDCFPSGAVCFVAIGDNSRRHYVTERLESNSRRFISLFHPTASISPSARIGVGSYIGEHAVVRTDSTLGRGVVVNAGAVISHHSKIGDFVLVGPNAAIASRGIVGAGSLVGVGACMRPGCVVGEWCTIGAGAVVINDISREATVLGNPAKPIYSGDTGKREAQSNWTSNKLW